MKRLKITSYIVLILITIYLLPFHYKVFSTEDTTNIGDMTDDTTIIDDVENADNEDMDSNDNNENIENDDGDYQLVGSSDILKLYVNESIGAIGVEDLRNGHIWYSSVPNDTYKRQGLTKALDNNLDSLFFLTYADLNLNNSDTQRNAINTYNPRISTEKIKDGIRMIYDLESLSLQIMIDIQIDDDAIIVTIPNEGIKEGIGSTEKVNEILEPIKEFIEETENSIEILLEDRSVRGVRRDVRKLRNEIRVFKDFIYDVDSALGMSFVTSFSNNSLNNIRSIINGGQQFDGIFRSISRNDRVSSEKKQIYQEMDDNINGLLTKSRRAITDLRRIRVGGVVSIEVLPFFGAISDQENGYVFYPDGSGAITYTKEQHPGYATYFSRDVYANESVDIDWEHVRDRSGMKRTMLPVYGIKNDTNAFIAAVTKGDASSFISFYPSGYIFDLNRGSAGVLYRREIDHLPRTGQGSGQAMKIIEKDMRHIDYEMRIMFIEGEDADYSGMACRYRDYLYQTGQLKKNPILDKGMPIGIDLLMGIKERLLLFDRFITLTTFKDAEEIIDYFSENGVNNMLFNLHGWMEDGYNRYPSSSKPADKLGGGSGLMGLSKTASENGVKLYLQDNYVEAFSSMKKTFDYNELALGSNMRIVKNTTGAIQLFSPQIVLKRFKENAMPTLLKYGVFGATFDRIGTFIYYDYETDREAQRADTVGYWEELMEASVENLGGAASIGGNAYTLKNADWLIDISSGATNYLFTDEEIPFYQMVVNGFIPYSSKPFNQFYDKQLEKLKTIEYGSIPYYKLTYEDTIKLKGTEYNTLFSSKFYDWKDEIIEIYEEYNTRLGVLAGENMIRHEKITKDLVKVNYSNNLTLYINYGKDNIEYDSHNIKAMDYIVIEDGGR